LEKLGAEDDAVSEEQAFLNAQLLDVIARQQEARVRQQKIKERRRLLELQYVKLHAEKAELVERELDSIAEVAALEEAREKESRTGSSPEAPSVVNPLNLTLPSEFFDFDDWTADALLSNTVEGNA
jgi:hypothetical protein